MASASASCSGGVNAGQGYVLQAVVAMLEDDAFQLDTPRIRAAVVVAGKVRDWVQDSNNKKEVKFFEDQIMKRMKECFVDGVSSSLRREKVWGKYHKLRSSEGYRKFWKVFLTIVGCETVDDPAFYQYISHHIFNRYLLEHHPLTNPQDNTASLPPLTFEECNTIRYVAGYVCSKLYKRFRSPHPPSSCKDKVDDLFHGIEDMLAEESEEDASATWLTIVDRGGLFHVNDAAYSFFVSIEHVIRQYLQLSRALDMKAGYREEMVKNIWESEDVNLQWSAIGVELQEREASMLMSMITNEWVTLRGFSFAGAFMELFKQKNKKSLQKSKGTRTKLQGKEKKKKTSSSS